MLKSILIGLDDSKSSNSALDYACQIASLSSAEIRGLYIEDIAKLMICDRSMLYDTDIHSPHLHHMHSPELIEQIEKQFKEETIKIQTHFQDICNQTNIKNSFYVARGRIDRVIVEESRKSDILIIGRRGTISEELAEPGPKAKNILRHTVRPVIVVPPDVQRSTGDVVIAYDGSELALKALSSAVYFANLNNCKIHIVTVSHDEDFNKRIQYEAKEFIIPHGLEINLISKIGNEKAWEVVMQTVKDVKAGLIVLGAFGDNRLKEFLFGSTTRNVLINADCPVLLNR